jgi:hypothetical protein
LEPRLDTNTCDLINKIASLSDPKAQARDYGSYPREERPLAEEIDLATALGGVKQAN